MKDNQDFGQLERLDCVAKRTLPGAYPSGLARTGLIGNRQGLVKLQPKAFDEFAELEIVLKFRWFNEERISTEFVRAVDVGTFLRGGKDHDPQGEEVGLLSNPLENFEAILARHL